VCVRAFGSERMGVGFVMGVGGPLGELRDV
jgi:hypothetical protein